MKEIYIQFKPKLWCMMLHQVYWNYHDEEESIHHRSACDKFFYYPTKKEHQPVYKR